MQAMYSNQQIQVPMAQMRSMMPVQQMHQVQAMQPAQEVVPMAQMQPMMLMQPVEQMQAMQPIQALPSVRPPWGNHSRPPTVRTFARELQLGHNLMRTCVDIPVNTTREEQANIMELVNQSNQAENATFSQVNRPSKAPMWIDGCKPQGVLQDWRRRPGDG